MKQELLEYIIRACAKEVLTQINEGDEDIKGAAAPPADGQGTADQPAIPNNKEPISTEPEEPKTPSTPPAPELKGVVLVNPKDKSKLQKVELKSGDDATLERNLHRIGAAAAGSRVKTALSTMRMVKDVIRNPNSSIYLYVGKYDPQSEELFLMADKSLQVAKDSTVEPSEVSPTSSTAISPDTFNPSLASGEDFAKHMSNQGYVPPQTPVDENLKKLIKKMVNELLDSN